MPNVIISKDAVGNGFAEMLSQLISQNLEGDGTKNSSLRGIRGDVSLEAVDLGERVTMVFTGENLMISLGLSGKALLAITADSLTVLDLARLKIKMGLPWFFDEVGLGILRKMLTGALTVRGMFRHPLVLIRLTKIFSVG